MNPLSKNRAEAGRDTAAALVIGVIAAGGRC